jgi:pimeloyl-ACP methyl ester carboxylesterase/tetratricopeptide (TPR) repeat protein
MASSIDKPITFVVPGQTIETVKTRGAGGAVPPAGLGQGRLKQSVIVGAQRGGGGDVRVTAVPGEDVVVLHIAGGPALMLHPETARDLLLAQGERTSSRSAKEAEEPAPGEIKVPARLQWRGGEPSAAARGGTRSTIGDVLLSGVDLITDLITDKAAEFAASEVVRRVDGQVDPGVYALTPDALPQLKDNVKPETEVPAGQNGGPLLVLVHGTFSNTSGTFSKLWTQHPQHVRSLFKRYDGRVYALDHPTLGVSPIGNALTLARVLAKDARLHLVTHSRGGLVAEVLARVCASASDAVTAFGKDADVSQREELESLVALVKEKGIRVDRIVRVACPARGTILASKRLDAYVSVFKWTLELAGIPVAPFLVDFLGQVAKRRADPGQLPGLAAQIPNSPLVKWLHAVDQPTPGQLRVVAGDIEGDSVTSWLKTLLADAFYWTDNDFVVQTRSMYGGAPRAAEASFFLDQGGSVSHFSYFSNERTAESIVNALVQSRPLGFRTIGPLSWAGQSSTGVRAARGASDREPASDKPAVFLLPGILGSNLKIKGERVWLSWRLIDGLDRLKFEPGKDGVEPDGLVGMIYDDLADFLSATHDVVEFAFDWRRPIEDEARRLAQAVETAVGAREKSGKPVRLLAHGMGGLVSRALQLERPEVWQRMMSVPGARLLMLGTPNAGSWEPMQVLSGDDTIGNILAAVGTPFHEQAARQVLAQFPGFIQLQAALLDEDLALATSNRWARLADEDLKRLRERSGWHSSEIQLDPYRWGVPEQAVLDQAVALRKRLDAQRDKDLPGFKDQLLLVVGKARFTPDGFETGSEGLVYLDTPEDGDGRVPLRSAVLPGVRTWTIDCEHGGMPCKKDAFGAYLELLQKGTTKLLAPLAAAQASRGVDRPAAARIPSRPSRTRVMRRPPEREGELFTVASPQTQSAPAANGTALRVTVVNGDLTFVSHPLLLGHYRSTRLTGTERVMDRIVDHVMEDSLKAGVYPDRPGAHQVFLNASVPPENPWQMPRPEAVIVVGLGEEGKLTAAELVHTVRQAVIAWAQREAEKGSGVPALFELAATLAGSGGGMTVGQSAQLIAQGVREANERLADGRWPRVGHLHLIELYLSRAGEAWRALQMHALASPGLYVVSDRVLAGIGTLRRPFDDGYRGADYDFISATARRGERGDPEIAYTVDTKRARAEVTAQATQVALMREIVASAASDLNRDPQLGRTLFQLLVPLGLEPFFGGTTEMVLELDNETAGIPWELLDTKTGAGRDSRPWAVRAKLLRKLRTDQFRAHVADANAESSILVIGEPECDPKLYPRLPGARHEALAVVDCFTGPGMLGRDRVKDLISPEDPSRVGADARTIINALFERDWRIVHIAGHGALPEKIGPVPKKEGDPPQEDGDPRGVVLSKGTFLGPREIESMRVVPELVFVNCCHLGAWNIDQLFRRPQDRARFAAGVADALIKVGVRCVIAAGWAVDDDAASTFAATFYGALLRGVRFIDAVAEARETARGKGGNTWAAYQCYGDPEWTFTLELADAQRPRPPLSEEFAGIGSALGLHNALETLAVKSEYQHAPILEQQDKLRHLEARFAPSWGGIGEIAEAFGAAWAAAKDAKSAIRWYEKALGANDGTASLKATEQLCNLRARDAWESVEGKDGGAGPSTSALGWARKSIHEAIALLDKLVSLKPTMERESLLGSAYKRLALVEELAGKPKAEAEAIARMKEHYENAEALGKEGGLANLFYPAMNRLAADLALNAGRREWKGLDASDLAEIRQGLAAKARDDPDFWSVVGQTELSLYEALGKGDLSKKRASLEHEYDGHHTRVSAQWLWASARDQLRFLLPKYAGRTTGAEREAARALLTHLEELAGGSAVG